MRRIFVPLIGVAAAIALVTPAEAADNEVSGAAAAPTTVVTKTVDVTTKSVVPATSVVTNTGEATVTTVEKLEPKDNNNDDSDKTGLWGLLGLLGLAGLAGLAKRRNKDDTTYRQVTGTAPPRPDGASGTGTTGGTTRPVTGTAPPHADGASGSR